MRKIIALFLIITLSGCTRLTIDPPSKYQVESSRIYSKPYEAVWLSAVDWFADHNVVIEKIEKESGLITAKYQIDVSNSEYLDFGEVDDKGVWDYHVNKHASLNITVRNKGEMKTKVNINFFGSFDLRAHEIWWGQNIRETGNAVSTGKLETNILDYIENQ